MNKRMKAATRRAWHTVLWILGYVVWIAISLTVISLCTELVTQPDTVDVIVGVTIAVLWLCTTVYCAIVLRALHQHADID